MKNNTTAVSPKSVPNVRMLTVTAVLSAIAFLLLLSNSRFRSLHPLRGWTCRTCPP